MGQGGVACPVGRARAPDDDNGPGGPDRDRDPCIGQQIEEAGALSRGKRICLGGGTDDLFPMPFLWYRAARPLFGRYDERGLHVPEYDPHAALFLCRDAREGYQHGHDDIRDNALERSALRSDCRAHRHGPVPGTGRNTPLPFYHRLLLCAAEISGCGLTLPFFLDA